MGKLHVRISKDKIDELDELAEELGLSRSDVARCALRDGLRKLRMEKALARYLNMEFTLSRAAEYAGVSIREMAVAAAGRGIPFFRLPLDQLRRDRERTAKWLKG